MLLGSIIDAIFSYNVVWFPIWRSDDLIPGVDLICCHLHSHLLCHFLLFESMVICYFDKLLINDFYHYIWLVCRWKFLVKHKFSLTWYKTIKIGLRGGETKIWEKWLYGIFSSLPWAEPGCNTSSQNLLGAFPISSATLAFWEK